MTTQQTTAAQSTRHEIRVETTKQLNYEPCMFGDASEVEVLASHAHGMRLSVPAVELEHVEGILRDDADVVSYTVG